MANLEHRRTPKLKLRGVVEQFCDVFEQSSGTAAIKAAMIETQRHLCFGSRQKLVFPIVPCRDFLAGTKPE